MARDQDKRWRCNSCGAITLEPALLTAPNPFDDRQTITGCPGCAEVGDFEELCDELGCTRAAGCGFPAGPEWGGYRRTCYEHSQWAAPTQSPA